MSGASDDESLGLLIVIAAVDCLVVEASSFSLEASHTEFLWKSVSSKISSLS